jgi:hypothetical protein
MIGAITKIQDWLMDIILKGLAMVYPSSWNFAPAAIAVQFAVKIVVYGFLACVIASALGIKGWIDKRMRWAQL